jgi:hypothetical protein
VRRGSKEVGSVQWAEKKEEGEEEEEEYLPLSRKSRTRGEEGVWDRAEGSGRGEAHAEAQRKKTSHGDTGTRRAESLNTPSWNYQHYS